MKKTDNLKKEVIKSMIELAEKEIIKNTIVADFYATQIKDQDQETANKTKIKEHQVRQTVDFNVKFNEYLKSL
jgi:hypothetical protein